MAVSNDDQIKKTIEQFLWEKSFRNLRINEMVYLFTFNYISHEIITYDDRDPPWINKKIKQLIQKIKNVYRSYILSNKNPQLFKKVKYLRNQLKPKVKKKYITCVSLRNSWIQ